MRDWSRVAIICGGRARTLPSQLQPVMPAKSWRAAAAGKIAINLLRVTISQKPCPAKVAELADAPDLGSGGETHGGSSPPFRTNSPSARSRLYFPDYRLAFSVLSPKLKR